MSKVRIILSGDWEGLYIDGKLVFENHELTAHTALKKLKIEHEETYIEDQKFFDYHDNHFPDLESVLDATIDSLESMKKRKLIVEEKMRHMEKLLNSDDPNDVILAEESLKDFEVPF